MRFRPRASPCGRVPCPAGACLHLKPAASRAPSAPSLPVNSQPFRLTPSAVRAYTLSRGRLRLHRSGCHSWRLSWIETCRIFPAYAGFAVLMAAGSLCTFRRGGFFVSAARPLILPPPLPSGNSQRVRVPVVRHGRKGRGCPRVRGVNRVPPAAFIAPSGNRKGGKNQPKIDSIFG